ncbi:MAG: tol-pal system protein YbgF [Acidobacteriota bacterium]
MRKPRRGFFAARRRDVYDFGAVITTRVYWILLAAAGCASPMSELRHDNQRLEQEVAELRADHRAQDRKVRDLEHQLAVARDRTEGDVVVPQLPVEVVAPANTQPPLPDGGRLVGVADDGTQIIYEGDAALGKPATIDDAPSVATTVHHAARPSAPLPLGDEVPVTSDRIEVTHHVPLAARTPPPRPHPRDTTDAVGEYRTAVDMVKTGKYGDAITALRAFLAHYPRHDYADNAQYWLGEAFYAQKDYAHALDEFRATIETYPRGNKVPDALLKVGYCYQALGQAEKARAVLEQVVNLYPKSEPAALAAKRLEQP